MRGKGIVTKISVDASAWIEYLRGSERGQKVGGIIDSGAHELFTPMSVVAEVVKFHLREKIDPERAIEAIQRLSSLTPLSMESSIHAAQLCVKYHSKKNAFGMLDAFVLATAKEIGSKILTFDNDFKECKEAIIFM